MIVSCNNEIKEVHYNGHVIQQIYSCGGELVYEATPPITTNKVEYSLSGVTHTIPCNSSSTLSINDIRNDLTNTEDISAITSVAIGNCVTSLGNSVLSSYWSLSSVTIPNTVTSISRDAFNHCRSLTGITIPSGVTIINDAVFNWCSGLTSIDIPSGVTSIGNHAFADCSSLTSIVIPSGVTSIGDWAFYDCSSLTSITIPSGVTSIGDYAFYDCSGLTSITVEATTPPTLGSKAFQYTNNCPIYVPSESVSAYQTAWSTYASRIQAIT